jgi:hypothetical protein
VGRAAAFVVVGRVYQMIDLQIDLKKENPLAERVLEENICGPDGLRFIITLNQFIVNISKNRTHRITHYSYNLGFINRKSNQRYQ